MKILIIGSGGREHALVKSFIQSPSVTSVHVIPGNDGMSKEALCHNIDWKNTNEVVQFCLRSEIDFVLIGPEDPLVFGLADALRARGILVVGPSQEAAQLEGSKIFAKNFMNEASVPTAKSFVVESVEQALEKSKYFQPPYILKADGLAAGKGVFICKDLKELESSARFLWEEKGLGAAGERALLEEALHGWELSYLILTNGKSYVTLPLAQDHKRLKDNDQGPNTGGMGTMAPLHIDHDLFMEIDTKVIQPSVQHLSQKGYLYRGVLFVGLMITDKGPYVLEYNVRFGDPETQVILPLLENDFALVCKKLSQGELTPLQFKNLNCCCVILAANGYPDKPEKGSSISGDPWFQTNSSYFIHAGTKKINSTWVTNGGRVLGAVGLGTSPEESQQSAYKLANTVNWQGLQKRMDIGSKILKKS